MCGVALSGALSSTLGKVTTDLIGVAFYGGNFGTWEDYAIAFAFGGLTGSLGCVTGSFSALAKGAKFVSDVALRPAVNQVVKAGTRGTTLNKDKYLYDVATRAVTYCGTKQLLKGNIFDIDVKIDLGKCFLRATFKAFYEQ